MVSNYYIIQNYTFKKNKHNNKTTITIFALPTTKIQRSGIINKHQDKFTTKIKSKQNTIIQPLITTFVKIK